MCDTRHQHLSSFVIHLLTWKQQTLGLREKSLPLLFASLRLLCVHCVHRVVCVLLLLVTGVWSARDKSDDLTNSLPADECI